MHYVDFRFPRVDRDARCHSPDRLRMFYSILVPYANSIPKRAKFDIDEDAPRRLGIFECPHQRIRRSHWGTLSNYTEFQFFAYKASGIPQNLIPKSERDLPFLLYSPTQNLKSPCSNCRTPSRKISGLCDTKVFVHPSLFSINLYKFKNSFRPNI